MIDIRIVDHKIINVWNGEEEVKIEDSLCVLKVIWWCRFDDDRFDETLILKTRTKDPLIDYQKIHQSINKTTKDPFQSHSQKQ